MFKKYFTPQEANKRIPYVKEIVKEILGKGKQLQELIKGPKNEGIVTRCENLQSDIEDLMGELEDLGCFYKDWNFEVGLVDFPSIIEGETVFLCWKSDEPTISWYHSVEGGFSGRRLIPEYWLLDKSKEAVQ